MWIARIITKSDNEIKKIELTSPNTERLWDKINYLAMLKEIIEIHIFRHRKGEKDDKEEQSRND